MFKQLKKMNISYKILCITLGLSLISQILIAIIGFVNMRNLGYYSKDNIKNLGEYSSKDSQTALKTQAENYANNMASALSNSSNKVLESVSNEVASFASGLQNIYQNSNNFEGYVPPLPNMTNANDVSNREYACEKAYVIDPVNSSADKSNILVYDFGTYPEKYSENIYKTNINDWLKLSDEERTFLKNSMSVVSTNLIPEKLKSELKLISNIFYLVNPVYFKDSTLSKVYLGTETGIYYEYSPELNTVRYDPKTRPWYIDAIEAKKSGNNTPVWQSSYMDIVTQKPCVTCSKAFSNSSGEILGVISADMFLSDIYKYLIDSKIGETGYSFIIDSNGKIVVHPDYISEDFNQSNNIDLLNQQLDESFYNAVLNMIAGKSGTEKIIVNNKNYYISYSPLETTGWSLGILTEIDEIIKPAVETKNIIDAATTESTNVIDSSIKKVMIRFLVIVLICSMLIIILAILLSNYIVNPLEKLTKNVKKIGQGDLDIKLPIESEDEIGQLSLAVNKMTNDLKIYIDDLAKTTAEKEKIHSELTIAKKIQSSMLPCIFPAFPDRKDFDIYAIMDPAKEVGGDFYDFFFIDKENLAVVIADVSGKGVSAALFMVIAKILLKNQAQTGEPLDKVLENVNNQLCQNNEADMFVTVFLGAFNIKTGKFTFANAGHNPPLIYRSNENKFEWIKCKKSFVLAGLPNIKYHQNEMYINKNDVLYLYTDGVTEAMNNEKALFGNDRLENILNNFDIKNMTVKDLIIKLRKEIDIFAEGAERVDDITMLALKNFDI